MIVGLASSAIIMGYMVLMQGVMVKLRNKQNTISGTRAMLVNIAVIVVLIVLLLVFALMRGYMLYLRFYTVPSNKAAKVRIVGITDLHGNMIGENQERIVQKIKELKPDFIVCLGDMVEKSQADKSLDSVVILTKRLVQIAPVFYVDGNHEQNVKENKPKVYRSLNDTLADLGAVQLEDEIISFTVESGVTVNLCGVTKHYNWGDKEQAFMGELKERKGVNVLACHYPESIIWNGAFEGGGLDLALCGHTHGGLVRVPLLGGYYAPEQNRWPMYDLGEYQIYTDTTWSNYGGKEGSEYLGTMIISGGLAGEHGIPRMNNPMEISVVEIE